MPSSESPNEVPNTEAEIGTILTYRSLLEVDALSEALLSDIPRAGYGDAFRELGLTRVSFWIQRDPDAAVVMWEGKDIGTLLERFGASSNPVLARWRGQLRVFSGPEEAESFWDATHHRLFYWSSGDQGRESEITIYREPRQIETLRRNAKDFQDDPSLMGIVDRVRRSQGFTRIETWHQQASQGDIILTLVEADDIDAAMAQIATEDNPLDIRFMQLLRSTLLHQETPPVPATLLARWEA